MYDFVDKFKDLNDKQQEAIILLLLGESNKSVASKVGVDENTVYRWRVSEPFKSIVIEMRLQLIENLGLKINCLGENALNKLSYLLDNAENENIQTKIAMFIIDKTIQYGNLEIIKRLDSLEERMINQ